MILQLPPQVFTGTKPDRKKFTPAQNREDFHWKPLGGLWTSSHTPDEKYASAWISWCRNEGYAEDDDRFGGKPWLLKPAIASVLVLRDPDDLEQAVREYGLWRREGFRESMGVLSGLRMMTELLDYEALSRDYDAMWIPHPYPYRLGGGLFFNVMDVESTLWLRWNFTGRAASIATDDNRDRDDRAAPLPAAN